MREVRDLAAGMRELIAGLRKDNAAAKSELHAEVARAKSNSQKVRSFARDLKEANLEVESMLGETGSNFPPLEESDTQAPNGQATDVNGVTKHKG